MLNVELCIPTEGKVMKINVYIPFFILSENHNNDRYTDPSPVQFVQC